MPKRTREQIHKDRRQLDILDALYKFGAPPEINWLIVSYTSESEVEDAEAIQKMQHAAETLCSSQRDIYQGQIRRSKKYQYLQLITELKNNWKQYKGRIFTEPWCHSILLDKYKELFNF